MSCHTTLARLLTVGLMATALAACATPEAGSHQDPATGQAKTQPGKENPRLRTGMTREQVRAEWGEPDSWRPGDVAADEADTWTFRREMKVVEQKAVSTQSVPFVDPISGEMRDIQEPVYSMETTITVQEITLTWQDGMLARWSIETSRGRQYNR